MYAFGIVLFELLTSTLPYSHVRYNYTNKTKKIDDLVYLLNDLPQLMLKVDLPSLIFVHLQGHTVRFATVQGGGSLKYDFTFIVPLAFYTSYPAYRQNLN